MIRSLWMCLALAAVCAGCATTEQPHKVQVPTSAYTESTVPAGAKRDPDNTFQCETEYETGSRIPVRNCRSLRQIEAERRGAQEWMNGIQKPQNVKSGG